MADREQVTKKVDDFLSRPSTLKELCDQAGREGAYVRVQKAMHRWRNGEGEGLSKDDAEWIEGVLSDLTRK